MSNMLPLQPCARVRLLLRCCRCALCCCAAAAALRCSLLPLLPLPLAAAAAARCCCERMRRAAAAWHAVAARGRCARLRRRRDASIASNHRRAAGRKRGEAADRHASENVRSGTVERSYSMTMPAFRAMTWRKPSMEARQCSISSLPDRLEHDISEQRGKWTGQALERISDGGRRQVGGRQARIGAQLDAHHGFMR